MDQTPSDADEDVGWVAIPKDGAGSVGTSPSKEGEARVYSNLPGSARSEVSESFSQHDTDSIKYARTERMDGVLISGMTYLVGRDGTLTVFAGPDTLTHPMASYHLEHVQELPWKWALEGVEPVPTLLNEDRSLRLSALLSLTGDQYEAQGTRHKSQHLREPG